MRQSICLARRFYWTFMGFTFAGMLGELISSYSVWIGTLFYIGVVVIAVKLAKEIEVFVIGLALSDETKVVEKGNHV